MLLAFAVTLLMWELNLISEVSVRPRYLTESVGPTSSGWSSSLFTDALILVLLLPARMVKHLSALNCMSQVFSQEPTEFGSDWSSSVSFLYLMGR